MIYVTGDIHGDNGRFKVVSKAKIKKGDTLLICGDFGFIWDGSKKETNHLKWIGKRKYNIAFVDGYNDNLDLIKKYPQSDWNGGKVYSISGKLKMLKRGEVYCIDGKNVLAFGGGDSIEREHDTAKDADKLPTSDEIDNAILNLEKCGNKVDIILTHDAPAKVKLFIDMENNEVSHLHTFLEKISKTVKFKQWYFGKYHQNKIIPPCYRMIFNDIVKVDY